jgi:hypothetical protein
MVLVGEIVGASVDAGAVGWLGAQPESKMLKVTRVTRMLPQVVLFFVLIFPLLN